MHRAPTIKCLAYESEFDVSNSDTERDRVPKNLKTKMECIEHSPCNQLFQQLIAFLTEFAQRSEQIQKYKRGTSSPPFVLPAYLTDFPVNDDFIEAVYLDCIRTAAGFTIYDLQIVVVYCSAVPAFA